MNLKEIHIGSIIKSRMEESGIPMERITNFMHLDETQILSQFESPDIQAQQLLRWSKLLKYDFFRLFSQHLILYAPTSSDYFENQNSDKKSNLPQFRKNIYTLEVIEFILELIESGKKTKAEIISEYRIPKTTLYKWIEKHKK